MAINSADIVRRIRDTGPQELFRSTPNDPLLQLAIGFMEEAISEMQQILINDDRVASGNLNASFDPTQTEQTGSGYGVGIMAEDYAKFIDQGVDGINQKYGSPYHYTDNSYRVSMPEGQRMKDHILRWIPLKGYVKPPEFPTYEGWAYVIARNIKSRGIRPSHFIEKTFTEERLREFEKAVGIILEKSVDIIFEGIKNEPDGYNYNI